ncbi:hypothetical protein V7S43_012238 [Phytophthora oleae]|uniref:PD-(D/E)XK endonuclease-like domain-containing protein n=1 Tax=Phytophthora oleae TaxID=2107226 RepID=A0ABD3F7M4_9STRA
MARQLRSLRHVVLLRQAWASSAHTRRLFSSAFSFNASNSEVSSLSAHPSVEHQSLVTSIPNVEALQRVRWILQQPQRRVLLLTGSSSSESPVRSAMERDAPAFELERRGHGIFGVREFCQLLLRESGRESRVFGHAQLSALLLHSDLELPGVNRLAATSTLQRRKGVQDLLQLFRLLEREGVTPKQYAAAADKAGEQVPQELAETYRNYRELLLQHNVTSWDGLVLDVLALCGVQKGDTTMQDSFSQAVLKEYTDVVVDDVQRLTPAMATLVGHLCGQPSVQSSASFSRVLVDGNECPQTQILEQQLKNTAVDAGRERGVTRISLKIGDELGDKRAKMQAFAKQVLTQSPGESGAVPSPIPFKCWRFNTSETEERRVGAFLAQKLQREGATQATVVCPLYADARRIALAFQKQGLPVRINGDQFAAATNSTGVPIHLFDEPGVNAVYSLLCALCFPSDSRHLYNVLRSEYFAFPAELLSWLMEKEHRSHVDLFPVLEAFVDSRGQSLWTSLNQREGEEQEIPHLASSQLESGLEIAESFVAIIKRLRSECHQVPAAEIVQSFLEESGQLETLLSPSSPEQERKALVLADFLRELETAQKVVGSDQVTFVAPYLQQLRETNLTSSASWETTLEVTNTNSTAKDSSIRVLPLTARALESIVTDGEKDCSYVLVLMSMRDSKFPGRMKRLTLPLPYELLTEPYPVQTRAEHLAQCEQLAYEALTLGDYSEVVLSFAELAALSSSKGEILSRIFQPIWHEGDRPAVNNGNSTRTGSSKATSPKISPSKPSQTAVETNAASVNESSHFWLSEVVGVLRQFVNRVFLPFLHHDKGLLAPGASSRAGAVDEKATSSAGETNAEHGKPLARTEESTASSEGTCRSPAPASSLSYEPRHLSYSQISEYLRCPHRYYLSRVMKLDGDVSTAMMFGRALHEGIAAFANSLAAAQLQGEVTEELKTLAAVEAEEAFMRVWVGDGYGLFTSKEQAEFLLDRGMTALGEFIQTQYGDLTLEEIVHVEKGFSFHVPEAKMELRGVWDRIDRVSRTSDGSSSFVIKEFKSNMGGASRNMRKLADESLQLKMYMYAFHQIFGEAPHGAKLQQIGGNYNTSKTKPRRTAGDEGFVHYSEKAVQEAKDAIVEVAEGLRRGDFEPKPSFGECAFCPYAASACHFATDDASFERQTARRAARG